MAGPFDFTGQNIEDSYQRVLQTDGTLVYDGTGSLFTITSASYATTASFAVNGGVTQLLAGPNITLSPTNGKGQVTVSSTAGGGGFNTSTGSYGSFYSTQTQTNPVGNVPRSMSFNSTDITNGVSISGSTSPFNTYIKTENAGVYDIQFSAQVEKTDSGTDEIVIWLRKNEIDLTDTATTLTLVGNSTKVVAAWNWFANSAANDYYQIIWTSADTGMRLLAEPISSTHPGIPSVILTVNRVDQFLSNTGSFSGSFTGAFTGSLFGTASWAINALTASYISSSLIFPYTGSALITGSLDVIGTTTITGSLIVSGAFGGINTLVTRPYLFDANGTERVNWGFGTLLDTNAILSVDWSNRVLYDSSEIIKADWENSTLYDIAGSPSIEWGSRFLYDSTGNKSYSYDARTLIYPNGSTVAIDYGTQDQIAMTGSVSVTGSLNVSGSITQNGVDLNSLMIAYSIALG